MHDELLKSYLSGIDDLRRAVDGMTPEQLVARPVAGRWSTLEVVCHLADSEAVFADRMKRILAEDRPPLPFADPALFSAALAYQQRDANVEVQMVALIRQQMAAILAAAPLDSWSRCGLHSHDGAISLHAVLTKAVSHLPHHLAFIAEKRAAMNAA